MVLTAALLGTSWKKFFSCFSVVFMFIASFLMVFLCLACHRSSPTFSQVYLIEAKTKTSGVIRTGYFSLCAVDSSNATKSNFTGSNSTKSTNYTECHRLGQFKGPELAYEFARHVARPYFLLIATVLTLLSFFGTVVAAVAPRFAIRRSQFILSCVTLGFTIITACWQQVAVQAAVVLIPEEIKRGHRAAGMVWSSVTMLIFSVLCEAYDLYTATDSPMALLERFGYNDYAAKQNHSATSVHSTANTANTLYVPNYVPSHEPSRNGSYGSASTVPDMHNVKI